MAYLKSPLWWTGMISEFLRLSFTFQAQAMEPLTMLLHGSSHPVL